MTLSRMSIAVAAVFGSLFVGYFVYFDKKRRSAPDFRKRLREKRKRQKRAAGETMSIPEFKSAEEMQAFFLQQLQLGEILLQQGEVDSGLEHICVAVALCQQPKELLAVMEKTIPPELFSMLMERLPSVGRRVAASSGLLSRTQITEDDVE